MVKNPPASAGDAGDAGSIPGEEEIFEGVSYPDLRTVTAACYAMLSHFSRVRLCATPETAAHQAPPSLGFSRQEQWSACPSPMHENEKSK